MVEASSTYFCNVNRRVSRSKSVGPKSLLYTPLALYYIDLDPLVLVRNAPALFRVMKKNLVFRPYI